MTSTLYSETARTRCTVKPVYIAVTLLTNNNMVYNYREVAELLTIQDCNYSETCPSHPTVYDSFQYRLVSLHNRHLSNKVIL